MNRVLALTTTPIKFVWKMVDMETLTRTRNPLMGLVCITGSFKYTRSDIKMYIMHLLLHILPTKLIFAVSNSSVDLHRRYVTWTYCISFTFSDGFSAKLDAGTAKQPKENAVARHCEWSSWVESSGLVDMPRSYSPDSSH